MTTASSGLGWLRSGLLARGTIGLREILFQSLAAVGPALALSGTIPIAASYAGGAVPLAVIVACIPCFTVALSIGELSKHLPSAGSIYTYPARALHPAIGFLVAWGYALASAIACPSVALLASAWITGQMNHGKDAMSFLACAIWFVVISGFVLMLGYRGVNVSAISGTILGAAEVLVFSGLAVTLMIASGRNNTLLPFTIRAANAKGFEGLPGIIAAAVFTTTALSGFEACAPFAEEAKDPLRSIRLGALISCAVVGILVVGSTYSAVAFLGPTHILGFGAALEQGNPWVALARSVWGPGAVAIFIVAVISTIGTQNAMANAATRTWYAMARIGLLPRSLGKTHPIWRSPHIAISMQAVLTLGAGAAVSWLFGPVNGSYLLMTVASCVTIGVYILTNISCAAYYWREKRAEFHYLRHGIIPLVGTLLLFPILLAATGTPVSILSFVSPLPYPLNLAGAILLVWFGIGIVYLIYLARRHPERLRDTGRIFIEEQPPTKSTVRS